MDRDLGTGGADRDPAFGSNYGLTPSGEAELEGRVSCEGRSVTRVMFDVERFLGRAQAVGRRPRIVLDSIDRLADSASKLLKALARRLADYPEAVRVKDGSGYANAFLEVLDRRTKRSSRRS